MFNQCQGGIGSDKTGCYAQEMPVFFLLVEWLAIAFICRTGFTCHCHSWKDTKAQHHTLKCTDWIMLLLNFFFYRNRPSPEEEEPSKVNTDPEGKVGALPKPDRTPKLLKKKQHCHRVARMRSTISWSRRFRLAIAVFEIYLLQF